MTVIEQEETANILFARSDERTAKNDYVCDNCHNKIEAGTRYLYEVELVQGNAAPFATHVHIECPDSKTTTGKWITPPWQLEDLAYLASRKDSSANWSEMGCFKTSTVLWTIQEKTRGVKNPSALICTTASGKGTYFEAIPALLPGWTILNVKTSGVFVVLPGGKEVKISKYLSKKPFDAPVIVLTHYNVFSKANRGKFAEAKFSRVRDKKVLARRITYKNPLGHDVLIPVEWAQADYLTDREWDFVALDEAHRVKNKDTSWVNHIKRVKSKHRHVMTGTGIINRPSELWSLLNFLEPKDYSSFDRFYRTFCRVAVGDDGYTKEVGVQPGMKNRLRQIIRELGPRRTLDEVMPHIKKAEMVRIDVDLSPVQKAMYDQIKEELRMLDQEGNQIDAPNVLAMLSRLRQICVATPQITDDYYDERKERRVQVIELVEPSSKLDAFMEVLEGLQWDEEKKQQIVVFSNFKGPLELLKKRLEAKKVSYIHMEQKDNDRARYDKWAVQFPKKEHQVFMATLQLGSESINLTSAEYLCFLDRSWSPKDNNQGIGRIRRPGQEGQPVVINIEAKGTVDKRVEKALIAKNGWFKELFGEEE